MTIRTQNKDMNSVLGSLNRSNVGEMQWGKRIILKKTSPCKGVVQNISNIARHSQGPDHH